MKLGGRKWTAFIIGTLIAVAGMAASIFILKSESLCNSFLAFEGFNITVFVGGNAIDKYVRSKNFTEGLK